MTMSSCCSIQKLRPTEAGGKPSYISPSQGLRERRGGFLWDTVPEAGVLQRGALRAGEEGTAAARGLTAGPDHGGSGAARHHCRTTPGGQEPLGAAPGARTGTSPCLRPGGYSALPRREQGQHYACCWGCCSCSQEASPPASRRQARLEGTKAVCQRFPLCSPLQASFQLMNPGSSPQGTCRSCMGQVRALPREMAQQRLALALSWELESAFKTCSLQQHCILQKSLAPFAMLTQHMLPQFSSL